MAGAGGDGAPSPLDAGGLRAARRWALAALVMMYTIVLTGVTVRLTGSGLGCPDWPMCEGLAPVGEMGYHAVIEFVNRMVALPTTVAAAGATWTAFRVRPVRWDLRMGTIVLVSAVLLNIALGALTIFMLLDPRIVSMHFMVSMLTIIAAAWTWECARRPEPQRITLRGVRPAVHVAVALGLLATLFVTILGGVLTTAAGPHSGGTEEQVIQRLSGGQLAVTVHARAAYVFMVLVAVAAWLLRGQQAVWRNVTVLLGLVVVQIALGEFQYRTGLPRGVVLAHVAVAAAIWLQTSRIATMLLAAPAAASREPASPPIRSTAPS